VRYLMKQNLFSMEEDYPVRDERGRDHYVIAGGAAREGDRLSFQDTRGRELAYVRRRDPPAGTGPGPAYELYYADELQAVVRSRHFNPARCTFGVEGGSPDDLHAYGDLPGLEYAFSREGHPVAAVSRGWYQPPETYAVQVAHAEDDVLILASTIIVDLCCQRYCESARA
jgi:uncharacterized protein YxjI